MYAHQPTRSIDADRAGCICHSPAFLRLNALVEQKFSRRAFLAGAAAVGATALWPREASAAIPEAPAGPVVFTNVRIFDGKSGQLIEGRRVVVEGNKIKAVEPVGEAAPEGAQIIDGGGRTLMPGLIDAHWHAMLAPLPMLRTADRRYRVHQSGRGGGSRTHADARLHQHPRSRRPDVRPQAGDRPWHQRRSRASGRRAR